MRYIRIRRERTRSPRAIKRTWHKYHEYERLICDIQPRVLLMFYVLVSIHMPIKRHDEPFAKSKRGYQRRCERKFKLEMQQCV